MSIMPPQFQQSQFQQPQFQQFQQPQFHQQVIYQADPATTQTLRSIRDRIHHAVRQHMNQHVRIQTLDGRSYQGVITDVRDGHLYLSVPQSQAVHRQAFNPLYPGYFYNNVIIPLVLYELLVITLLYT